MPKKILFESAVHQILREAERVSIAATDAGGPTRAEFDSCINSWSFAPVAPNSGAAQGPGVISIRWTRPVAGEGIFDFDVKTLYPRADTAVFAQRWARGEDPSFAANSQQFESIARDIFTRSGVLRGTPLKDERLAREERFHDEWARSVETEDINVILRNEVCTAPEMRYLTKSFGDLRGKTLLDVGCGLGEASVYFALKGAKVTSLDLSPGMLQAAQRLAQKNGVTIETHLSSAETPGLEVRRTFDIIYMGNLLHHVEIAKTLDQILPHLSPDGVFVSWDPVEYNPLIQVYRKLAANVRTPDEHPFKRGDLKLMRSRFASVDVKFFWLTTLIIFIWMALAQRRHPGATRYWKDVVDEGPSWAWLYGPLERIDRFLLKIIPALGWICWNVAIVARKPISITRPTSGF